jgi:hypothetical protein
MENIDKFVKFAVAKKTTLLKILEVGQLAISGTPYRFLNVLFAGWQNKKFIKFALRFVLRTVCSNIEKS